MSGDAMTAGPAGAQMRRWSRFSTLERIGRNAFYVAALLAVIWAARTIEIIPEFLYDAHKQTADLFARMWPIDWSWYPEVVHEALIDDDRRENAFGLLMSLNMLIEAYGFDYTGADCRGWMADAGFSRSYVEYLAGPDSIVVGIK